MHAKDLTPGEKLYLYRRRLGFSEVQMAVDFGVGVIEYRQMELDGPGTKIPYLSLNYFGPQEECVIRRRRLDMTQEQVATKVGVSAELVDLMEVGLAHVEPLLEFWRGE